MNTVDVLVIGHLERNPDGSTIASETFSSSALICTGGHNIVVDTSSNFMRAGIRTSLKQIGKVFPDDIDIVVLTHTHPDHMGNVGMFRKARVMVRAEEAENVPDSEPIDKDEVEITKGVKLVYTPGHTMGSMSVFVEGDRNYVIAGDAIPLKNNFLKMEPPTINCGPELALSSIKKISAFADIIVPGHGSPFLTGRRKRR